MLRNIKIFGMNKIGQELEIKTQFELINLAYKKKMFVIRRIYRCCAPPTPINLLCVGVGGANWREWAEHSPKPLHSADAGTISDNLTSIRKLSYYL